MTLTDFYQRMRFNGGADRHIGRWKILDIHEIPTIFLPHHEVDFYCCDDQNVYLLRLANASTKELHIVQHERPDFGYTDYWIAKLPIKHIDDAFLEAILEEFSQKGIAK